MPKAKSKMIFHIIMHNYKRKESYSNHPISLLGSASSSRDRTGTQLKMPATTAHGEQSSIHANEDRETAIGASGRVARGEWRAAGVHGPQRKRSIAAPYAGSSCTEKSRWHSSVPSTPSSHVRGRAWERRECLHPHATCRTSRPSPARGRGAARRASRTLSRMSRRC